MVKSKNFMLGGLAAFALLAAGYAPAQSADAFKGVLEGVVKDASGKPVVGAFVRLKNAEKRLGFMVISQDGGGFSAKGLPPGNYEIQSIGGDFQSKLSGPVAVTENAPGKVELALTDKRGPDLTPAWPRRLAPEVAETMTLPAGAGKELAETRCNSCHSQGNWAGRGATRESWHETVKEMQNFIKEAGMPPLTHDEEVTLIEYFAQHWAPKPPPDPNSRLPHQLMQGEARKYRVVQFDLPNPRVEPHDVAVDPWGIAWSNQRLGGVLSRFDAANLSYTEISPPLTTAPKARPGNLQISKDGIMWVPDPNEKRWIRYDIKEQKWASIPFPSDFLGRANSNSLALSPDGSVWGAGPGALRRYDPATDKWTQFTTPTWNKTKKNPGGYGISIDAEGRGWMALQRTGVMARADIKTGEVDELKLPGQGTLFPRRMATDNNGDPWVALWQAGKLVHINYKTAEMTAYEPPTPMNGAYAITMDRKNGYVWVTLHRVDKIARFNPKTKEWLELPLPQAETDVRRIEIDPTNPNRVFWSGVAHNARIGFVELLN
jgi:streptogramin lyase/mono/diheme cytochrome c family protein